MIRTGSLNVTGGHLTVTGGGNSFAIGRGLNIDPSLHGGGVVNLSGSAILEIGGSDPVVGTAIRACSTSVVRLR